MDVPMVNVSPNLYLRGENLEYYKNIESLKEMTRQAKALLDRSNAKYENILDDQTLGYKVRAKSISDSLKSTSPELLGRCRKCGLAHGAANFCIVEQIMTNEREIEDDKRRSKISKAGWSLVSFDSKKLHRESEVEEPVSDEGQGRKNVLQDVNLLDKMTPSQVLDNYEALSYRYGPESGKKFLLARALQNPPGGKIEKWTTPCQRPKRPELSGKPTMHYADIRRGCDSRRPQTHHVCPNLSADVTKKMEELVELTPPCDTRPIARVKKWKEVLKDMSPIRKQTLKKSSEKERRVTFHDAPSETGEMCHCNVQTCQCLPSNICTTTKIEKKCQLPNVEEDYDNNYLLNMRRKIWLRRETKRRTTQMQKERIVEVVVPRSKSDEYIAGCKEEQYETLKACLTKNSKNILNDPELDKYVKIIAEETAPTSAINPRQWDRWNEQMKEQEELEEMDEVDSLPSDTQTDEESSEFSNHTGFDFRMGRIPCSRIPHADDVYDLIDNLFDKIALKFETSIRKNSFKENRLNFRPTYAFLHHKINLKRHVNPLMEDVMQKAAFPKYLKRLTPLSYRKARKLKRLKDLESRIKRAEEKRKMVRGLQLGKQYRRVSKSWKYSQEGDYKGFRTEDRQMLLAGTPSRFARFNLEEGVGKAVTMKRIHYDYRLIYRLFDDAAKSNREDLIDEGMQQRLREFQQKMYSEKLPPAPITDSDINDRSESESKWTKKEEIRKQQKAANSAKLDPKNLTLDISDENMFHYQKPRHKKYEKCRTASENKFKDLMPSKCTKKEMKGIAQKSISNTDVKEKRGPGKITHAKVDLRQNQVKSGVRSLTNLLPPVQSNGQKSRQSEAIIDKNNSRRQGGKTILKANEKAPRERNRAVVRLPLLKTQVRTSRGSDCRKISDESLPSITQRESVENLMPRNLPSKPQGERLTKKPSTVSINRPGRPDHSFPKLVNSNKLGQIPDESLSKSKKSRRVKTSTTVSKQSGIKAWR